MAAFKFRLAAVLRLRGRVKEEKQWELGALQQAKHRLLAEIDALETELHGLGAAPAGAAMAPVSAIELLLASDYALALERRIKEKIAAGAALDKKIDDKKLELVEALRGVKSLERLREHQADKFRREQDAVEQKFTDEVAQRKFVTGGSRHKLPR